MTYSLVEVKSFQVAGLPTRTDNATEQTARCHSASLTAGWQFGTTLHRLIHPTNAATPLILNKWLMRMTLKFSSRLKPNK